MDHPDDVFIGQAGGDNLLSARIRQSHPSHIKTEAIQYQTPFFFPEQLHHIPAGVHKDEDITAVQTSTHGVGYDAAQAIEALAHIDWLVI